MAWVIGDLITASKLGNENYNNYGYFEGTLPDGSDWIEQYIGNNGQVYSHVASGTTLFWGRFRCGLFGGGKLRVKKWVDNGWNETILSKDFGWNTNEEVRAYSTGPGLYRIYSETAFQFSAVPWWIEFGQTGLIAGQKIVKWDDKFSSLGTRGKGTLLTLSELQSGYIGGM